MIPPVAVNNNAACGLRQVFTHAAMLAEVRGKSLNAWVLPIYNSTRLIPITTQLSQEQQPLTMTRAELIQQLALRHPQLTVQDCDLVARTILNRLLDKPGGAAMNLLVMEISL
uniref:Uncharacterized protein n=1 Tax=mine drainage metagenome TaxID=410659 RepID=E6QW27_9ZZZZ